MNDSIEVRPFAGVEEYEQMVDYFLDADDEFLRRMGVCRATERGVNGNST